MSNACFKNGVKTRNVLPKNTLSHLNDWNNTSTIYPREMLIHQLFEQQVSLLPDKIAVEFSGHTESYLSLNQKSNQLAHHLVHCEVHKGDLVVILMDRSLEMIMSILSILKAGATYLPIDPSYPAERIRHILGDSKSKVILTKTKFLDQISFFKNSASLPNNSLIINIETTNLNHEKTKNLHLKEISSENLAYVIYTSGSTGKPKGVMVSHQNVNNYIYWFTKVFKVSKNSKFDFSSSLAFDFSVSCTLVPLLNGSSISICSDEVKRDPYQYLQFLKKNKITHNKNTPSYFNSLLLFPEIIAKLANLKWIILGGEPINPSDICQWFSTNPTQNIVNEYGPTETTVATIAHIITADTLKEKDSIPIGKPAFNTQVYILNKKNKLCNIGEIGELYISGDSVSKGYLNQPELTSSKFIESKLSKTTESVMYKTGDLAYWLPDGNIVCKGRTDNQVKIRGYRIELEEIEQIILKNQDVAQASIVIRKTKRGAYLVAFIVAKNQIDEEKLKNHLQLSAPDYMIPALFIFIDSIPLTPHEKANKEELLRMIPKISRKRITKPSNEIESELISLYANYLPFSKENICISTNFFSLGGNSLTAIRVINSINKKYKINLNISDIIKAPTITLMAELIDITISSKYKEKFHESISSHFASLSIIPLKKSGTKSPLFLLHPLGGTIFSYRELINFIDPERPCYAIQDPSIPIGKPCFSTFEKMASCYLDLIRRIQPYGPYILSGHSFGGTLAFEIARQLLTQDETIEKILLLDTWAFFTNDFQGEELLDESISSQLKKNKTRLIEEQVENIDLWVELNQYRANLGKNYNPPKLDIELTLLKAESLLPEYQLIDEPTNYWNRYTTLPVKTISVPGNHETMLVNSNAKSLAASLDEELNGLSQPKDPCRQAAS